MISAREAASSVYGAYRLFLRDPGGLAYFNVSVGGFWRSFSAALIVAPVYLANAAIRYSQDFPLQIQVSYPDYLLSLLVAFILSWLAFPVAMSFLCQFMDRQHQFLPFTIAYNWASLIQGAILFPAAILVGLGGDTGGFGAVVVLVALVIVMVYAWYIALVGLQVSGIAAFGIILMEFALTQTISLFVEGMVFS